MTAGYHLVLGGSHGIGYAYAKYRARERGHLILVGRNRTDLVKARRALLRQKGASVDIFDGDLLDGTFRSRLRTELEPIRFRTILIGGPSPAAKPLEAVDAMTLASGTEIVLVYPFEFLVWAMGSNLAAGGEIFVLGSSASQEPLCGHQFFLSALLRRSLDQLIDCLAPGYSAAGKRVTVWRPKVVMSRLARRYARTLTDANDSRALRNILAESLGAPVISPDSFINQMLRKKTN